MLQQQLMYMHRTNFRHLSPAHSVRDNHREIINPRQLGQSGEFIERALKQLQQYTTTWIDQWRGTETSMRQIRLSAAATLLACVEGRSVAICLRSQAQFDGLH